MIYLKQGNNWKTLTLWLYDCFCIQTLYQNDYRVRSCPVATFIIIGYQQLSLKGLVFITRYADQYFNFYPFST